MRPLPVEPLAGTAAFVIGVAIVRGLPVPVVDVGLLLGVSTRPQLTRFVSLRLRERLVALAVEAVVGVRSLTSATLIPLPPLLDGASHSVVASVGTLDKELLVVLRATRIVPESVWQVIEKAEERS